MFKACLFDLDGVIVDTAKYHFLAWRRMANELGFDFTEHENEQLKGVSRIDSLNLILGWGGKTLSDADKLKYASMKNEWYLDFVSKMDESEILPDVPRFFSEVKEANMQIVLGSSSKNAALILTKIGLINQFDHIIDGRHINKGKPDPEIFLKGAAAANVNPKYCIVFEDAVEGLNAAIAASMKTVGIGDEATLGHADMIIPSFVNVSLKDIINKIKSKSNN